MLQFFLDSHLQVPSLMDISIHLMLQFFIIGDMILFDCWIDFNTSYVTVLPDKANLLYTSGEISIHLMLQFFKRCQLIKSLSEPFQYILCYSSSEVVRTDDPINDLFQYILCYSSS